MATKFLDKTGLSYFCSKIKAWCNATFAAITHNQASNTINTMTGYSKPSSGSAIATSDSLNSAIGKLEVKIDTALDDSNYVHKTGNEVIQGVKTFNTNEIDSSGNSSVSRIIVKNSNLIKGTLPSYNVYSQVLFTDNSSNLSEYTGSNITNRLALLDTHVNTDGSNSINMSILKYGTADADQTNYSGLVAGFDANSIKYATAPSTSNLRSNGQDVLTRDWIPKDIRIVHTTGDEVIQGIKEFKNAYDDTSDSSNSDCSHSIVIRTTRFRKGTDITTLPDNDYCNVIFQDNNGSLIGHDGRLASVEYGAYTNGTYVTRLGTYKNDLLSPNTMADLGVGYDPDGIAYAYAPVTSTTRTGPNDIITRYYFNNTLSSYLPLVGGTLTGNLTISKNNSTPSNGGILLSGTAQNYAINISDTSITKGTAPSATKYQSINFYGKDTDSYTKRLGYLEYVLNTSNVSSLCLRAYNTTTNTNTGVCTISANVDGSGNPYTYAPTPGFTEDSTQIATTRWVRRHNRICCGFGENPTQPFCLIASSGARVIDSFCDWGITLLVDRPYGYGSFGSGICTITFRTSSANNNESAYCQFRWLSRTKELGDCIKVGLINTPGNAAIDIYFYNTTSWLGGFITVLSQSGNRYNNPNAYYPAGQGFQTYCAETGTPIKRYTTINEGAQDLWGENYTDIIESAPYISDRGGNIQGNVNFVAPNAVRGVVPSARSEYDIFHYDKNNAKLGAIAFYYETTKESRVGLFAYNTTVTANNSSIGQLSIGCNSSGNIFTQAPTPVATDSSTQIATTAWVRSHTRNNLLHLQGIDIVKGSNPSNTKYWAIYACDKNGTGYQGNAFGIIEVSLNSTGDTASYVRALSNDTSNTNSCTIGSAYKTSSSYGYIFCTGSLEPSSGNTCGTSSAKWSAVWATNGTIQTSDERVKTDIDAIPEYILDAWENVQWKQFKMKDSVEEKGNKARLHTGIVAQQIQKEFEDKDIDVTKYGFFCWDKWDDSDAILDSDGNIIVEAIKADEQYSIRYDEALCIEAAYQRRKNKILENRISELETQVQNMLQILESFKGA